MDIQNCLFFYDTEIVPGTAAPVAVPLTDSLGDLVTDGGGNVVTGKVYIYVAIVQSFCHFLGWGGYYVK